MKNGCNSKKVIIQKLDKKQMKSIKGGDIRKLTTSRPVID